MKKAIVFDRSEEDEDDMDDLRMECDNCYNHIVYNCDICRKEFEDGEPIFCSGNEHEEGKHYCLDCVKKKSKKVVAKPINKGAENPYNEFYLIANERFKEICDRDDFRLMNVEKELFPILESTDNEDTTTYRHMPFNAFFINQIINFDDFLIYGIMLEDNPKFEDAQITFLRRKNTEKEWNLTSYNLNSVNDDEKFVVLDTALKRVVINFLDFLLQEKEYKMTEQLKDNKQNEKREKRGKAPMPKTITIKLSEKLRAYAQAFAEGKNKYANKFLIRGHIRHFRSTRYTKAKDKQKWIYPYWKGEGIIRKKDYLVKT